MGFGKFKNSTLDRQEKERKTNTQKERKKKKKNAREGPKRDLPAEDDFGPELVQIDNINQSFFDP